jgi:hypothetical protein
LKKNKFSEILKTKPLYLVTLPVFFVLHGFLENYGFVSARDAFVLCLSYILLTFSIAVFSWVFFRNWTKAALITVIWMSFFFFFGAIHEFFKEHESLQFFSRYSFLLSAFFGSLVIIFIILKKIRKPFFRTTMFLNVLFLIYLIVDLGGVLIKVANPRSQQLSVYGFARESRYNTCDTCAKPNIYLLLMDEYSSSLSLKETFKFDNSHLDSFLVGQGFQIQSKSKSNYNFTAFSMSATLNMSFIEGIQNIKAVTSDDYATCGILVRDNEVIKFLDAHGYEIVNYSVFDLAGHPAMVEQSFLPLKTKLITDRTLFARMNKDIGWLLMTKFPFSLFKRNYILKHRDNNKKFQELVEKSAKEKKTRPRFVYAHFYMPHPPYYYDRHGKETDNATLYKEYKSDPLYSYLDYLIWTNDRIKEMITTIRQNEPDAMIILLSDHGYRKSMANNPEPQYFFQNLNAVYFPDGNYTGLYDSITNVNMFRVILNKTFNQQFSMLPDSTVFLKDKKPAPP